MPVHPVQLYEAILAMGVFFLLLYRFSKRTQPGEVACALGIGYALIRFSTGFFRADNAPIYMTWV
ncbi:MAG: hypothetical protein FJ403_10740 [Verrucomicrobia bacterium]|nr:hypothetical protein [Verrucomicrobiota bacterium]